MVVDVQNEVDINIPYQSTWNDTKFMPDVDIIYESTCILSGIVVSKSPRIVKIKASSNLTQGAVTMPVFSVMLYKDGLIYGTYLTTNSAINTNILCTFGLSISGNYEVRVSLSAISNGLARMTTSIKGEIVDNIVVSKVENPEVKSLYKSHTITNFQGDAATMFNVPLTPKRILQKWAKYLAISVHGSDSKQLEFVSSDIESSITSRCDYETADVVENAPLNLSTTTPLFLPCTISFDTPDKLIDIADFNSEKYKYVSIRDEKKNKVYKGWINIATFALAKKKEKQITLQAKTI
jgi:hypothetical protein